MSTASIAATRASIGASGSGVWWCWLVVCAGRGGLGHPAASR